MPTEKISKKQLFLSVESPLGVSLTLTMHFDNLIDRVRGDLSQRKTKHKTCLNLDGKFKCFAERQHLLFHAKEFENIEQFD